MADGWRSRSPSTAVAHDDLFLPRSAVVGSDRARRLDHRLAIEPAARDHSRPSDPKPRASTRRSAAGRCRFGSPIRSTARPILRITETRISPIRSRIRKAITGRARDGAALARSGAPLRYAQTTLLGRSRLGPAFLIGRLRSRSGARRLARQTRRARDRWRATSSSARPC